MTEQRAIELLETLKPGMFLKFFFVPFVGESPWSSCTDSGVAFLKILEVNIKYKACKVLWLGLYDRGRVEYKITGWNPCDAPAIPDVEILTDLTEYTMFQKLYGCDRPPEEYV